MLTRGILVPARAVVRATGRILSVLALAVMVTGCTGLFFQPMRPLVRTPADIGLAYEDATMVTSDRVSLHGWFLPAAGVAKGTVLFLHGNAQNISTHIGSVMWLPAAGYNVLLFDYRGYGRSEGVPTVDGAQRDIDAATAYLLARPDVDRARVVLFGQSLGGALAGYYAARGPLRRAFSAVILDSAFTGYRDIAREKLGLLWWTRWLSWPAGLTVNDDFSLGRVIGDIAPTPLLLIAGGADNIVPPAHSERLFAAAHAPKTLWIFPTARHIEALGFKEARTRLIDYLSAVNGPR